MCALRDKPTGPIRSACVLLVEDDDDNQAGADADFCRRRAVGCYITCSETFRNLKGACARGDR